MVLKRLLDGDIVRVDGIPDYYEVAGRSDRNGLEDSGQFSMMVLRLFAFDDMQAPARRSKMMATEETCRIVTLEEAEAISARMLDKAISEVERFRDAVAATWRRHREEGEEKRW
jgi:hypothetical protein